MYDFKPFPLLMVFNQDKHEQYTIFILRILDFGQYSQDY